jgi:hypothetical protein
MEVLLMFTQDDFCAKPESSYRLVTTASRARRRLNTRGLTLDFCRELFPQLRSDELFEFDPLTHESRHIANPIDFDLYIETLRHIFVTSKERMFPLGSGYPHEWGDDPNAKTIVDDGFFTEEAQLHFPDVTSWFLLRSLLEVIPDDQAIVLDISDLVYGGWITEDELPTLFEDYTQLIIRRIELDYKMYGFVLNDDPSVNTTLRRRVSELGEAAFLAHVLYPLLARMKFERLRSVSFHGPGEFGADILPFRYTTPLGTLEYYALQAKDSSNNNFPQ